MPDTSQLLSWAGAELVRPADGSAVALRPLQRSDRAGLDAAVAGLSDRSRYLRFATAKPQLSARELDRLTEIDHRRHEALLGIDPRTDRGITVASVVELKEQTWGGRGGGDRRRRPGRGRGLGTLMLRRIIARAREEGHI